MTTIELTDIELAAQRVAEWSSAAIPLMIRVAHQLDWMHRAGPDHTSAGKVLAIVAELEHRAEELPALLADLRQAAEKAVTHDR